MANFLDKMKINTAVTDHVKLDLSSDHITTANFMQFNVAWSKELVPGEKISVNMETFTRLAPMPVPTFGRARINNRAFFVPFRTIFPGWNDFITDTKHTFSNGTSATINYAPTIEGKVFWQFFFTPGIAFVSEEVTDPDALYDYMDSDGKKIKLLPKGRQFMKVLNSLGYTPIFINKEDTNKYSALPLLAYAKVYSDWYYPSAYADDSTSQEVNALFNRDDVNDFTLTIDHLILIMMVSEKVCYDSDYFVSAWQNPTTPNNGSYSSFSISDISTSTGGDSVYTASTNGTPITTSNSALSQYALNALRSLTDYMKRHQLVGARALDRYLSRFGIQLSAEKLRRSVYIGTTSSDIQFGDIMSTSDTSGAALGDYAGKGIGYGTSNFDFETDEYGIMIIVSSILPKTGYYQGVDRNVLHTAKTDYWTPEFDNLGTQAIAAGELFVPAGSSDDSWNEVDNRSLYNSVFGWTPRYAEYKVGRDRLTGDFRYDTMNALSDSWHTMRQISYSKAANIKVNSNFVKGADSGQYSRIFYNTDPDVGDKFNVIYHFDVASYSPMKALFDTYEFEEKGKEVTLNANGVKMN